MTIEDNLFDAVADEEIRTCLDLAKPKSFFLYAGAGSGKTRSLVEAVRTVCREQGRRLSLTGQRIGVITYTNAACDEIQQRLEFNPRVEVSTIHAFAWSLIAGHDSDIRTWVHTRLLADISDLEQAQAKGRSGKASDDRARSLISKRRRLEGLGGIARFVYSPTGDNRTRDALNHTEVITMTSDFLGSKPGLSRLLVTRFPVLLVDESQDTNKGLMDALLYTEATHRESFCLGLFGDTMQRIYADGKERLADAIPQHWARPRKQMNHRCPKRVIELINRIRLDDDGISQTPRSDAETGIVRLFIAPERTEDKRQLETVIAGKMAELTGDESWAKGAESIKTLALEHLMAARRFGFESFFGPLYTFNRIRTSLLQGTGHGIGLFTREVLPLVNALRAGDRFAAAALVRRTSPLLERDVLAAAGEKQSAVLRDAKEACDALLKLILADEHISARQVLIHVARTRLFVIPDVLQPFATPDEVVSSEADASENHEDAQDGPATELTAWREALAAPLAQIEKYDRYVRGISQFDTHQGVKGREFPRVMVVVSDNEAGGFMFNYDKLFGMKAKSKTDLENEQSEKETSIDRTRRLFYVTCSRAEESLAVVYYAANSPSAQQAAVRQGWFKLDEIELV